MKRAFIFILTAFSLLSAVPLGAGLSSQQPISLQEKTVKADLIVVGKVTDIKSRSTEPKTTPYTFVSVFIEEIIKGKSDGDEITIMLPGGSDDEGTTVIEGMPSFRKRERVLLFLIRDVHSDNFFLVHGGYGKYLVGPNGEMTSTNKTLPEFLNEIRQFISK